MITGYNKSGSQTIDHYSLMGFTKVYSAEKINNTTPSVKIKEIQSKNFNELVDISLPIDTNNKWSVINFLNNENDDYFSINTYLENGSVGVSVTKLKDNFELDNSFGSGGHVSQLFTNTSIQLKN